MSYRQSKDGHPQSKPGALLHVRGLLDAALALFFAYVLLTIAAIWHTGDTQQVFAVMLFMLFAAAGPVVGLLVAPLWALGAAAALLGTVAVSFAPLPKWPRIAFMTLLNVGWSVTGLVAFGAGVGGA